MHGSMPTYSHKPSYHGSYQKREQHIHRDWAGFCEQDMFVSQKLKCQHLHTDFRTVMFQNI